MSSPSPISCPQCTCCVKVREVTRYLRTSETTNVSGVKRLVAQNRSFSPLPRFLLQMSVKREPTSGLEPLTLAHYERSIRRCRGLHELANPAYLSRFLFSGLPVVAPYCVPGGVRVSLGAQVEALERIPCGIPLAWDLLMAPRGMACASYSA